jgi:SM-20-related protein
VKSLDPHSSIVHDLEIRGWSCRDAFVDSQLAAELLDEASSDHARGGFRHGATGTGGARAVHREIRGDEICWLAGGASASQGRYAAAMEELRLAINRDLQLGLFDHEAHFARYAAGTHYARHLDRPSGSLQRILSVVLYLNPGWRSEEGGALRLHTHDGCVDLLPEAGRLAIFLSDRFEHEVLPATRERWSVAGWFRRRE